MWSCDDQFAVYCFRNSIKYEQHFWKPKTKILHWRWNYKVSSTSSNQVGGCYKYACVDIYYILYITWTPIWSHMQSSSYTHTFWNKIMYVNYIHSQVCVCLLNECMKINKNDFSYSTSIICKSFCADMHTHMNQRTKPN